MQKRALGLSALVFLASALVAAFTVRHAWDATAARDARWLAQSAAEVPAHLAERVRCLAASVETLAGAIAVDPDLDAGRWRILTGTTSPAGTCLAARGVAWVTADASGPGATDLVPRAVHVVHHTADASGVATEAVWAELLGGLAPDDLRGSRWPLLGPAQAMAGQQLALLVAAVPAATPGPGRGWAALLVSPSELFGGLIDPGILSVRVEDLASPAGRRAVLDTLQPQQPVVATRDLVVGHRALRLTLADARPATRGTRAIVGAVTALGLLQTLSLTWLVYTLAASRERLARKAAETDASLRREESETRKLSLVARHATDLLLLTDAGGRIEWANAAFLQTNGYEQAEVTGQMAWTLLHGPETPLDAVESVRTALATGGGCRVETVNYTKARVPYWVSLEVQPVHDAAGGLTNFIAIARDVTEARRAQEALRKSEQQYRRVVEQVEQVIFQLDKAGNWTFLNRAWRELTGYEIADALGRPLVAYLHPDDRPAVQEMCGALLACQKDECHQDMRLVTNRGSACWVTVYARPVVEDGALVGVAGTITDITSRRHVQQELERARLAAERASAAKSEFLKSMSHEMRTPLNGVLGLMELLSGTHLDPQQVRYVAVARASATHLATLITDILDLSRIEGGTLTLERSLFDLPDLVESSLDAVAADAGAKHLRLSCTVTQDVPTWVIGDPGRLRQVLVNLLANAVKFTEQGEVHVQASAQVDLHTRKAMVRLEVHDTGIGMTPELVDRLFLPFTPGDASNTRRHSGTGLGLTICKRLVDAMDGTIAVRSVERAGATFTVTLPIEVADAAMVETQRQGDAPLRVLAVVQDDVDRGAIERLLEGWRFDAAVVADCEAALGHVQATTPSRWRFGVVLLDVEAPGATGFAARLREMTPEPGLVWITPEDGRVPTGVTGVRDQIVRPVKGSALFDAIMQAVVGAGPQAEGVKPPEWTRALRVLVAEDHDINQMVVRELLLGMGCEVDLVANGEEAVAAAMARPHDVILMDCQMPVLDGLEATRRIRQAQHEGRVSPAPHIIALTANATADDRQACLEAGMDAYLTKPVRGTVLQRTLQRLIAGEHAGHEDEPAPDAAPVAPGAAAEPVAETPLGDAPDAEDILDPVEVLLRCNHNGDLGARMLQLFAESLPTELEALEAAAAANDTDAMARIAHKMRGAAATLAAVRLAGSISGVELFLKYGDGGPLSELLADVRHESALFLGVVPQIVRRLTDGAAQPEPRR